MSFFLLLFSTIFCGFSDENTEEMACDNKTLGLVLEEMFEEAGLYLQYFEMNQYEGREAAMAHLREYIQSLVGEENRSPIREGKTESVDFDSLLNGIEAFIVNTEGVIVSEKEHSDDEFEVNLKQSINQYENLIRTKENKGQDSSTIRSFIATLEKELDNYKSSKMTSREEPREINRSVKILDRMQREKKYVMTIEEKREKGLKEIFAFYTRAQMLIGKKPTFEQIEKELNLLSLGKFTKFARDFEIQLPISLLTDMFKKVAVRGRELPYEKFRVQ